MPEEGYTERVSLVEVFAPVAAVSGTVPIKDVFKPDVDGILQGGDMLWLRKMVRFEMREVIREELAQAVECFFARGLDNLMTAIKAPPHDEMEEIAAILTTLTTEQFETIIAKVREKLA